MNPNEMPEVYAIGTEVELVTVPDQLVKRGAFLTQGRIYKVIGYNGGSLQYLIMDDANKAIAVYRGRFKKART